jgi:two-component system OmpR family sensor kinase
LKPAASLGSYIRSAARGTYSAYRSVPIRWRLAGGSAALTFIILASFAVIVGALTNRQVRSQFDVQLGQTVDRLVSRDASRLRIRGDSANCDLQSLFNFAEAEHAQIRIFSYPDGTLLCTQSGLRGRRSRKPLRAGVFATMPPVSGRYDEAGYRVVVRSQIQAKPFPDEITLLYAQRLSDVDQTLARVQAFLLLGVLGGAVLALLAGLFVSDRAMSPIKELTSAAREIGRTEDATRRVPHPEAEDEIAELARTLEGMLGALDASRTRTQRMLDRQREFVADASHELRTPLAALRSNIQIFLDAGALPDSERRELQAAILAELDELTGLVSDVLELARGASPSTHTDSIELDSVIRDAVARAQRRAPEMHFELELEPTVITNAPDRVNRAVTNLIDNARKWSPPEGPVEITLRAGQITVRDHGPGIPSGDIDHVFERFYRSQQSRRMPGSGLGLAIVKQAAEAHGGQVSATNAPGGGAIFYISFEPTKPMSSVSLAPSPAGAAGRA